MFEIKCVYCKFFNLEELCEKGLSEENCAQFELKNDGLSDKPDCNRCEWFSNGFCDFDLSNSLTCRRFKRK